MTTPERKELAAEILRFIEKHAMIGANYDPEYDDPDDRFNGPDPSMLNAAASILANTMEFPFVHSSWGSMCYQEYRDNEARAWHDGLIERINALRPKTGPAMR